MKKMNLGLISFLSSLGVVVYVVLVSLLMNNIGKVLGPEGNGGISGALAFLLLFIFSAALTGSLVLGKPVLMYLDGAKKEAIRLFALNILWIFIFFVIAIISLVVL